MPVTVDGCRFDSTKEAKRWCELKLLERQGEISTLERQVRVHLQGKDGPLVSDKGRRLSYVADFRYFDRRRSAWVYEDAKGYKTPEYKLKKAILRAQGMEITEV